MPEGALSYGGSIIDNYTANYIHIAADYPAAEGQNPWSSLELTRFFRSRDAAALGSFAAGGFCNYDIKMQTKLRDLAAGTVFFDSSYGTRIFDPNSLTWVSPQGTLLPTDDLDNPVVITGDEQSGYSLSAPVRFVRWTTVEGNQFKFELLNTIDYATYFYGHYEGRLVRMQDRNGYGTTIQYKTWTPEELAASPERKWQIDQVIGDSGQTMSFSYHAQQYGGRWVVSQIVLPNGQSVTYSYTANRLTSVAHADASVSTFSYGGVYADFYGTGGISLEPLNGYMMQSELVDIFDPKAEPAHRRKSVALTIATAFSSATEDKKFLFNQASQLVTAVMNESGEVTYNYRGGYIYDGKGSLKLAYLASESIDPVITQIKAGWKLNTSGVLVDADGNGLNVDDRDTPATSSYSSASDERGITKTYSYSGSPAGYPSTITYSDGTSETFTYNALRRVTRYKDRLGYVTKLTYDDKGNPLTKQVGLVDNGSGGETVTDETATTTYEYYLATDDHKYLLKAVVDPLGKRTDYHYDDNHRLAEVVSPPDTAGGVSASVNYVYNNFGQLTDFVTAGGWSLHYTYDVAGRRTQITHADNSTERFIYGTGNDAGLLVKYKDRAGVVTKYEYDASGRRIKTITSYSTMDLADNETLITDPALKVEEVVTYIPGTELKASSVRAGEKTTYTYDYRQRLVETKTQPRVGKTLANKSVYQDNKLFSTEDPYGRKTFYAYRASDAALVRTIQATVPSVNYADFAAVLAATRAAPTTPNPTSLITDFTVDAQGGITETIDPLGVTHKTVYDSRGRKTEQVAAWGTSVAAKTKIFYDLASRVTEIQHPRYFDSTDTNGYNKSRTTMTYTDRGLLASRTESVGTAEAATETYTYNLEGRQLTRVDARGYTWTTVWNACCGRQQATYDPYGHGTIVNVDNLGRVTHTATVSNVTAHSANYKDPIDAQTLSETTTKYDTRGRVTARTVWLTPPPQISDLNNVPIYTGPPVNNSASPPAAPYGLTTTYTYDDNLTDGTGLDATFSAHLTGLSLGADSDGSAVLTTNPAGERTLTVRDGLGRTVKTVALLLNNTASYFTQMEYDNLWTIPGYGVVLQTNTKNGIAAYTSRVRTDGAGRTIESLDAWSYVTAFTYNANGRRLSVRDPNAVGQDCTYDALGRDLSCVDTTNVTTSRTYDLAGNVKSQTDGKGKVTNLVYDSRGRRTSMTDRINAITSWTFDLAGNELTMTDAENQTTTYGYDNVGRRVTIQWPDHVAGQNSGDPNYGIETTDYDAAGRVQRKTNQLGDTITHVYDLGSRLWKKEYRTKVNSPSGTIASTDTFTYDARSRMLTGVSGQYSNTVTLTYDEVGRKNREYLTIAGQLYQMTVNYDGANRVQNVIYPDGQYINHTYTTRDLLSIVKHVNGGTALNLSNRSYDPGGRLSSETLGNGLVVSRTYTTGDNTPLAISNSTVGNYTYGWDNNKNKTSETITGAMANYTSTMGFDDQNRLASWNRSNGDSQAWTLSAVNDWQSFTSNGTAVARTHGPTHEVLTVGSAAITHDNRGNMTGDEFGITRTYDTSNKPSQAIVPTGSARGIVGTHTYKYDVLGRRVRRTIGGSSPSDTVYVHLGDRIYTEYTAGQPWSNALRRYAWGAYVDELVCQMEGTTRLYPHRNQQYSTVALTNQSQAVVERYAYTSYGDLTVLDPAGTTIRTTPPQTRFTYTGREYDHEAGTYHFRARIYAATLGRFTVHDRILYPDGWNTYAGWFASNRVDPSGASCDSDKRCLDPKTPYGFRCAPIQVALLQPGWEPEKGEALNNTIDMITGTSDNKGTMDDVSDGKGVVDSVGDVIRRGKDFTDDGLAGLVTDLSGYDGVTESTARRLVDLMSKGNGLTGFKIWFKMAHGKCGRKICYPFCGRPVQQDLYKEKTTWHECTIGGVGDGTFQYFSDLTGRQFKDCRMQAIQNSCSSVPGGWLSENGMGVAPDIFK